MDETDKDTLLEALRMNIERLTYLCEWIEAGAPEHNGVTFNMRDFTDCDFEEVKRIVEANEQTKGIYEIALVECGTVCCIAGSAVAFFSHNRGEIVLGSIEFSEAIGLLELTGHIADELFMPDSVEHRDITPAWAARCVRKLIATDKVDWEGTRRIANR